MMEMFKGHTGKTSAVRVVGITGAMILYITMTLNMFFSKMPMSSDLISAVKEVVVFCLGYTAVEKFSKQNG